MTGAPTAYRPNVGVILVNRDGLVFVAARLDNPADAWQMPQGGIDKGEDPRVAALRELEEEIGTGKAEIVAESEGWHEYDLPPELVGKMWGGKYRGQKQKWFVLRFLGKDKDIDLDTRHPEFRDWKWVPFEQVPDLIVPFKRELYRELVETFGDVVKSLKIKK
jgi:putative (di)nucleoside polyphosphate hydrolase